MNNERISGMIDDVITTILETEESYNPYFDKCEVLPEVAKDAHINLLLAKHNRDKHKTQSSYEVFFAKHEKEVKRFFAGLFEYDESQEKEK